MSKREGCYWSGRCDTESHYIKGGVDTSLCPGHPAQGAVSRGVQFGPRAWLPGWGGASLRHPDFLLLGGQRLLLVGQAVDVGRQYVDLVLAEVLLLGRHLAIAAVTDGLLQLGQA